MKKKKLENLKLGGTEYSADGLYLQTDTLKQLDRHIPSEEELKKAKHFLYDENSGNVHLFPENVEEAKKYAECIKKKQALVRKWLENDEKFKKNMENKGFKLVPVTKYMPFAKNTDYKEATNIFTHIHIQHDERNYDLMFIRFYKDENNKTINCILKCLQFEMYTEVKSINIYPESRADRAKTLLSVNTPPFYYNPGVNFNDSAETIADEFLKFIEENEKKYEKEH